MPPARLMSVDRPHVVPVAALNGRAGLEVDAERRAEERQLRVVDREGVARQQDVDVAARG